MSHKKDLYISIVLLLLSTFLVNSTLSKAVNASLEQGEITENQLAEKELLEFTFKNLKDIYLNYGKKAENISEHILKDFPLPTNVTDKDTLRKEFEIYNNNSYTELGHILFTLHCLVINDEFIKIYNGIPNSKNESEDITRDFNLKVLTKIRAEHLDVECTKSVNDFVQKLKQKLEDTKINFTKRQALKFKNILKFDEEMPALGLFVRELCESLNADCGDLIT